MTSRLGKNLWASLYFTELQPYTPDTQALACATLAVGQLFLCLNFKRDDHGSSFLKANWQRLVRDMSCLLSMTTLSPPFETKDFSCSFTWQMSSPSFTEDWELMGYYFYGAGSTHDPPMLNIVFETVDSDTTPSRVMEVRADGHDSIGNFELTGEVLRYSGRISFLKRYYAAPSWSWSGALTPFGIAGMLGDEDPIGWIWIWKTR